MNHELSVKCLILFIFIFGGCVLDRGGEFRLQASGDAALDTEPSIDQNAPDVDSGDWPETSTPDADASPDVAIDTGLDSPADADIDTTEDATIDADAFTDVVEDDSLIDAPEDTVEEDSPIDSPVDALEADSPNPVLCYGTPTKSGDVMICGHIPGGTSKSLMFKAEINSGMSGQSIPFKSVCWSDVGVVKLACFPCPGPNLCWPVPGGGFPHVSVQTGDVIKFQPGIADGPGLDMKNTLCDLGKCFQGDYIVYSGHTEVCRVNSDGTPEGSAQYEGTGTNVKIVCTL